MTDRELMREYVERGSERAFESLVHRHVDLVFGTARRRTGDHGAAEEITQNVFMALARKAMWLQTEDSLAGWLHRTALLESQQWWRGEARRRRREQAAVSLETTMRTEERTDALSSVLDDALLELRTGYRQAVLLKFLEGRNYREIGAALGIGEDAARKRVEKALDALTESFRKRGVAAVSVGSTVAVLEGAALGAPAGLAAAAAASALSGAGTGSIPLIGAVLSKLLGMGRTQIAGVAAAMVMLPAIWQGAQLTSARGEHRRMEALLGELQTQRSALASELPGLERQIRSLARRVASVQRGRLAVARESLGGAGLEPALFLWDETADYVRVPKSVLNWIAFDGSNTRQRVGSWPADVERTLDSRTGRLSPILLQALGFSQADQDRLQQYCQMAVEQYRTFAETQGQLAAFDAVTGRVSEFVRTNQHTRVWKMPELAEPVAQWKSQFEAGLAQLAGAERARLILRHASHDSSLSRCFQNFGTEDRLIVVTPLPSGGVSLAQRRMRHGEPSWTGNYNVSFASALTSAFETSDETALSRRTQSMHQWLGRPLPASMLEYLEDWRAANPEVPDEPEEK